MKLFKTSDCWGKNAYCRNVEFKNSYKIAKFIIYQEFGKYNIAIQLPHIRNTIICGLSSYAQCDKKLVVFIKEHQKELLDFYDLSCIYKNYRDSLEKLKDKEISDKENKILDIINQCKNEFFKYKETWPHIAESLNIKDLISSLKDRGRGILVSN